MTTPRTFLQILQSLKGKTAISFHSRADPDAVASALALKPLVAHSVIRAIDSVDASAKHVLAGLGYGLKTFSSPKEIHSFDNLIFVDVSSRELLGGVGKELAAYRGNVFIIDHHLHGKRIKSRDSLILRTRSSCAEVIDELWKASGKKLPASLATLLLIAVLSDSAGFKSANAQTFEAMARLLRASGMDYDDARELAFTQPDFSERMACLKSVARAQVTRVGQYIVATTTTIAFERACCQALIESGADVAFAANVEKGRLSGVKRETLPPSLSIGKIMEAAGNAFGGSGGGHENAGGARGSPQRAHAALERVEHEAQLALKKLVSER